MIRIAMGVFYESYVLFMRMAPYLLFGFFFAGFLRIFLDTSKISRALGGSTFLNSVKASLFGMPLPLCSCSVIPAAMSLRKEGASEGSTLSFLISTPATGVDSVFTTFSLLGGFFTVYRVIASFIAGVLSGSLANFLPQNKKVLKDTERDCSACDSAGEKEVRSRRFFEKMSYAFRYAFTDLLSDNTKPLLTGIFLGGLITFFIPDGFIEAYVGEGIVSMLVILAVSIPMYVCANASVPVAAALILKGLSPGAVFVFLLAGPATNIVTMSVVGKNLGKRALVVYLGAISVTGILLGLLLNRIFDVFGISMEGISSHGHGMIPGWLVLLSGALLVFLMVFNFFRRLVSGKIL